MTDEPLDSLTPGERALLDDPATHASFVQVPLAGRLVEAIRCQGLTWHMSSFEGASLRDVVFVDCTFSGVLFTDSRLERVTFERCRFVDCRFERTWLDTVLGVACTLEETTWRKPELRACRFEGSTLSGGWFEDAHIALHMQGGVLRETRFTRCSFDVLQLSETRVEALRLSYCTLQRFQLQFCAVERLQALGGACVSLQVYAGSLRDVKLGEWSMERMQVEDVGTVESLHINDCQLGELSLLSVLIDDLYVYKTSVSVLTIQDGRVAGWFTHSALGPGSSISDGALQDFFWDESECDGLLMRDVLLENGLCARGARFRDLRLVQLRYSPQFELVTEGASFERSDTFGRSTP
ncbi:MAG TPA: pentapeptide repeat-containing protein [Polyangiales bacterium]